MNGRVILIVGLLLAALLSQGGGVGPFVPPTPVPGEGFRFLGVRDDLTFHQLPRPQQLLWRTRSIESYLEAKKAEFRWLDDDYQPEVIKLAGGVWPAWYAKAIEDSKGVRPWIIVSNGRSGVSRECPADEAALLALLKQYGGE